MSTGDDELRIRLEGKAELLEATLQRYRVLVPALASLRWKNQLRKHAPLLGEVARAQPQVDEALTLIARRAEAEAWAEGAVLACAHEVRALRSKLRALVERRRGEAVTRVLATDLAALARDVAAAPRLILPGERWAVACQLLPDSLAGVQAVARFGRLAEQMFTSPLEVSRLPSLEAFTAFEASWRESQQILQTLWGRLKGSDLTGGVVRSLRRRALREPRFTDAEAGAGPALLVHAQYWHLASHTRMAAFVNNRLEPARAGDGEVMPVFGWLLRRQADPQAALTEGSLADARLALLELAALLRGVTGPKVARPFATLQALARRADAGTLDDDWSRLRASLLTVVHAAQSSSPRLAPVYESQRRAPPSRPTPLSRDLAGLMSDLEATLHR